jgi:hypothetical protein
MDSSGKVLKTWGEKMFVWPHGTVGPDGSIYVGETVPGKIGDLVTGHTVRKLVKRD